MNIRTKHLLFCWLLSAAGHAPLAAAVLPPADGRMQMGAQAPDPALDAGEGLIGRALFVRGFYLTNDLSYDAAGKVSGAPKPGDWTLAGMDVKKVFRHGAKEIELDGLRVAIRYNPDNHQFERHPQNDEKMRLLVADPGNARMLEAALDAIFAQGLDPRLQQATPPFWQHYFNPGLAWKDALTGVDIVTVDGPNPPKDVEPPVPVRKVEADVTNVAAHDKVRGAVQLRLVVDATGMPQRLVIVRPLGYGLDERAVEAVAKWRFTPGRRQGKAVACSLLVNYSFEVAGPPR